MIKMFIGLHVSSLYCRQILMKLEFSRHIFEKSTNIKFHGNPPSGSGVVSCGRTDRRKDMTKLIVAFRNFVNAPKKRKVDQRCYKFFLNVIHIIFSSNEISVVRFGVYMEVITTYQV
jgi:hypothetical protein